MVRYNGNNTANNRVEVDFVNQTVRFKPVGKASNFINYIHFFLSIELILLLMLMWICIGLVVSDVLMNGIIESVLGGIIKIFVGVILLLAIVSLIYFNKDFQKRWFPKWNYIRGIVESSLIPHGLEHYRWKKIGLGAVVNRKVIIPYFDNVMIEYKAFGDFSAYLKKINIHELFVGDDKDWFCVFEFQKTPQYGHMEVRYE